MNDITTFQQLQAQIPTTYIMAIVFAGVSILLSIGIATMIPWSPGAKDRSYFRRRLWFLIFGFVATAAFFLINYFFVLDRINSPAFKANFLNDLSISTGVFIGIYMIVGIILMIIFKKSKYGSILNRKS